MNFDEIMQKMRDEYLKNLESQLVYLKSMTPTQNHFQNLESFFHKLKGSGASYGVPEVSEIGRAYEEKAKQKIFSEADLDAAYEKLKKIFQKHSKG